MMDLNEGQYKNDFRPISNCCSCYTCRKFTRAYINHLLNVNELLAPILLTLHNLHHYATFFKTIRTSIQNNKFQELTYAFTSNTSNATQLAPLCNVFSDYTN